ncbi:ankyrin repeat-containing domain protein [Trichoderma barbatum]
MFFAACFFGLLSLPSVRADGWDDFANNLATDLAPFLSLFGEQITKQYLSESITTLDYFIFAMAPMGILTAVVSAIRVCGSPSLRAFIGRAQEGRGIAEAELCSSTSRDVCELYNNGGIARVFGRPKILEIVYDPDHKFADEKAGIYTFREFVEKYPNKWKGPQNGGNPITDGFAPNLSLNVGIKRQSPTVFWAVAIIGMLLQTGVLVFAVVVTYYLRWEKEDSQPESYACPLTITGTIFLCGGIFLCAHLVGQSTNEQMFDRDQQSTGENLYWVQPGGQVLGDQVFDAFCCSDNGKLQQYITSWKSQSKASELLVWAAVGTSIAGFVMQFVGLRAIHSAVSVAQLGVIMLMSGIRAALRMQRLKPEDNFLAERPDEVVGHELDWLALHIGGEDIQRGLQSSSDPTKAPRLLWRFCGTPRNTHRITPMLPPTSGKPEFAAKLLAYRTRLAQLTQSPNTETKGATSAQHFGVGMVEVRDIAQRLALAMESTVNVVFSKSPKIGKEWKNAESMFWSFACDVASAGNALKDSPDHTLHLQLTRSSQEVFWRLENKSELEGLLGLWLWSLKSDPEVEELESQSQLTVSRAAEISARRIISINENMEINMKMWFGNDMPNFSKDTFRLTSIQRGNPSTTVWELGKNKFNVRLFGWHAKELSQSQQDGPFTVWSASANSSLLSLCAQEVFGFFISSILDIVDDVGDINIQETLHFRLENTLVSEIVKLFTETQLGPKEDALLCVLPLMIPRLSLSSTESALIAAKKRATEHRRRGDWMQAETVLRWAWNICITPQLDATGNNCHNNEPTLVAELAQQATVALGELYRWAMRSNDTKKFGSDGIEWLSAQKSSSKEPLPSTVDEIIDRYKGIAEVVGQGNTISGDRPLFELKDDLNATLLYLTLSTSMKNEDKGNLLCSAAKHGWVEVVIALLELGTEPDFKDPDQDSRTALSLAAESGNIHAMKELIDGGAFPNSADATRRTPLFYASESGRKLAAEILLGDQRVDPDTKDERGWTPLFLAAASGHEAVVQLLIESGGVDLDVRSKNGQTPLFRAAREGHEAVVKLLSENDGVDLDARDNDGQTPLSLAMSNGHEAVAKLLINRGADINTKDKDKQTPLFEAAKNGHEALVKLLVEKGADVNAKDKDGKTPLIWAVANRHEALVKLLVERGADVNAKDEGGQAPLVYAIRGQTSLPWATSNEREAVLKLLIEKGADVNAKGKDRQTPLVWAAMIGQEAVVKLLVERGAVINAKGKDGETPLILAVSNRHEAVVKLLVERGADVNAEDDYEQTPLSWAVRNRQEGVVKLLIKKGADVNAMDIDGQTPLFEAAKNGHEVLVKLLVEKGADINARDTDGQTPLLWAARNGHEAVVKLLQRYLLLSLHP